jgi:alpha-tubulin suppressor-like RCC1 family protein
MAVSPRPAAAAPADFYPIVNGPKCPDVVVVAARGSGELPQNSSDPAKDWTSPAAYTDLSTFFGVGQANYDLYQRLWQAAPRLHFGLAPVQYQADAVFPDVVTGIVAYQASVESGAALLLADVDRIERTCGGGVKYLFTGYSQGAWVVHKALWQLPRTLVGKVVGVALFGDPEFVPFQEIVRDPKARLTRLGSAVAVDVANTDVPRSIRSVTGSYCFPRDPVCQAIPPRASSIAACVVDGSTTGTCAHLRYVTNGKTAKAARFLRPHLPTRSVWPRLTGPNPPAGRVGVPYTWTAKAAPTTRTSYTWTALDAVPPGLTFSSAGVLSGTPATAGRYSFRIEARSVPQDRIVSDRVSVRIRRGSAPPPSGCANGSCTVAAWGSNGIGELGNGTTTASLTPLEVSSLSGVTAIAAGIEHSLALRTDGTVWEWGANFFNEPEDPTLFSSTPVQVSGLSDVTTIAGGGLHSLALRADGTVWAWGFGEWGQLGNGTTTSSSTPVQVSGLSDVTAIAAGADHSLALRTDGTVWAWGYNYEGQLGNGTTTHSSVPVQVSGLTGVTAIAAGSAEGDHSLALRSDGSVWAWGGNARGQLGTGTTTNSSTPVQVNGLSEVTAIAAGTLHSLALRADGTMRAWGFNYFGQLGNGTTTDSTIPVQVSGLSGVATIGAGHAYSFAVLTDGTLRAWGDNTSGQLGDGTTTTYPNPTPYPTPVQVIGLSGVTAIAAGNSHSLALHT